MNLHKPFAGLQLYVLLNAERLLNPNPRANHMLR